MLNRLLLEHDHILRKLNLLELQYLDMCRGKIPDYSLMRSIIVYIQEYPEKIHHPLEDMIFSILIERIDDVEFVQELITEHTQLELVTRRLRASIESLSNGLVSSEELELQLSEFLVGQRQHIYLEEAEVYPLVQSVLTRDDWKKLHSAAPVLDEPLFGRRTRQDYERLYREIEDRSKSVMLETEEGHSKYTETERQQLAGSGTTSRLQ
jgi:hemerythrin-like domain-containing protein